MDSHSVKEGGDGYILSTAGAYGIEPHRTHYVPCAHLSAVFVATEAVGVGGV